MAHNFKTSIDVIQWVHDTAQYCLTTCQFLYEYLTDGTDKNIAFSALKYANLKARSINGDEWKEASRIICNDYLHGDAEARSILRFKVAEYKYAITGDEYQKQYNEIIERVWKHELDPFIPNNPDVVIVRTEESSDSEIVYNNGKWLGDATLVLQLFYREVSTFIPDPDDLQTDYKTMPRTHRIAAVWGLIDKMGLSRTKDRTKLAAFVEAVTGGNIEARPKDTVSYKYPTKDAKEAVSEWLKKIGME